MARFVFYMHRELGHLRPALRSALDLCARGHQVAFLVTPPWRAFVEASGLGVETFMDDIYPADLDAQLAGRSAAEVADDGLERRRRRMEYFLRGEMEARLAAFDDAVLVADPIHYSAPLICAHLGRPCVQLSPFLWHGRVPRVPPLDALLPFDHDDAISEAAWAELHARRARERQDDPYLRSYYDYVDAMANRYRATKPVWNAAIVPTFPELQTLICAPRALEYPVELPPQVHMDVASLPRRAAPRARRQRERVEVHCGFGSNTDTRPVYVPVLRTLISWAVGRPDLHVTFSVGERLAAEYPVSPAAHVEVEARVDQLARLDEVDVMIGVGGLGTMKECLAADVPMLIVPLPAAEDAAGNAMRLAYHGGAIVLDPAALTPARLDDGLARARALRGEPGMAALVEAMRSCEATDHGAELLERFADRRRL